MLKLLDLYKSPVQGLVKYKDYKVESVLSTGDKTLSFSRPSHLCKNIHEEMYIQTREDEYVIKQINTDTSNTWTTITAILNVEELEGKVHESFASVEKTAKECLSLAFVDTGWLIECSVPKKRTVRKTNSTAWDILQQVIRTYRLEPIIDSKNKKVYLYDKVGSDKGVYFTDELNLKSLNIQGSSTDFCTRIVPIGKDGLKISDINGGKDYVENYQYVNKVKTIIWKDERYSIPESLKEDAEAKLADLSKPKKAFSASVIDLARTKEGYNVLSYGLGDVITLIDRDTGTKLKQRIVKEVKYPDDPYKNTIEISNTILSFEELQREMDDIADTVNNITSDNGTVDGSTIDEISIEQVPDFAVKAAIILDMTSIRANIETLNSHNVNIKGRLTAVEAVTGSLDTTYLKATDAEIKYLTAENAKLQYATVGNLNATNIEVQKIQGYSAAFKEEYVEKLTAVDAAIATLEAGQITVEQLDARYATIQKLESDYATIDNLEAANGRITIISGDLADYKTIVAGQFTAQDATIEDLKAQDAKINTALIGKASIADLEAIRTKTEVLEADYSELQTLVNGNLTSDNIHSLILSTDKVTVQDGFIKNAMIDSLAFNKITGIDINTTNLTVHSNDGKSTWKDNTIQIADANRVRVQIGKDAAGDYNIYIWDKNGKLMFAPLYGVQEDGIKKAIIRNDMVSENANISGSKLDIEDVIKEVNGATTTIKGTRIKLDKENQTLDAAFSSMKTYVDGINSRTEDNETALTVAQGQISTLISNTTVVKDGKTVQLKDAYNSTVQDINSIKTTIGEHTSILDEQKGEIVAVQSKANTIESDLNGTKQTVSSMQSELTDTGKRIATAETSIATMQGQIALKVEQTDIDEAVKDVESSISMISNKQSEILQDMSSITTRVSEVESTQTTQSGELASLTSRMSVAEQKITKDGIIATVGTYYAKDSDLTAAENRIATAESTIAQHTNEIALTVKEADITGNYLIGKINLTSTTAQIAAKNVNLTGYVTLTNLSTEGQTTINGGNIKTGTISADRIDVIGLFAKDIMATGTIRGVNLVGATGEFSGQITANTGVIGPWSVDANSIYRNDKSFGNEHGIYLGINGLSISDRFKVNKNGEVNIEAIASTGNRHGLTIKEAGIWLAVNVGTQAAKNVLYLDRLSPMGEFDCVKIPDLISNKVHFPEYCGLEFNGMGVEPIYQLRTGGGQGSTNVQLRCESANKTVILLDKSGMSTFLDVTVSGRITSKGTYNSTGTASANMCISDLGNFYRSTSSSRRYKHSIEDIQGDLNPRKILKIPVRQYIYNLDYLDTEDQRYNKFVPGFIAEEVAEHYPIAAEYANGQVEDWNARMMIPPILAIEQNHDLRIARNEDDIEDLKQKYAEALSRIIILEAQNNMMQEQINRMGAA